MKMTRGEFLKTAVLGGGGLWFVARDCHKDEPNPAVLKRQGNTLYHPRAGVCVDPGDLGFDGTTKAAAIWLPNLRKWLIFSIAE
jgi:hypothetical protein